jgi:mevalonate kinase
MDSLEKLINQLTTDDWKDYKCSINEELKEIKRNIEKLDRIHGNRITKLETMLESVIKSIEENSNTSKDLMNKISSVVEQLAKLTTESKLNDDQLRKDIEKNSNLDKLLDKNNRPLLLLIVFIGSALLISLGANLSDVVKLIKPF